jgi:predicted DNA-binding protein YlxM (UPF0122 family)
MDIVDVYLADYLEYAAKEETSVGRSDVFDFINSMQEAFPNIEKKEYMYFLEVLNKKIHKKTKQAPIQFEYACLYLKVFGKEDNNILPTKLHHFVTPTVVSTENHPITALSLRNCPKTDNNIECVEKKYKKWIDELLKPMKN